MNSQRPSRNAIVAILGTPDGTEGNLNDPREQEENGVRFNEKWIYRNLRSDPAGTTTRIICWRRYDFQGTFVRNSDDESWRPDCKLVEAAVNRDSRLPELDRSRNPPVIPRSRYRPASEFLGKTDLGGGFQEAKAVAGHYNSQSERKTGTTRIALPEEAARHSK